MDLRTKLVEHFRADAGRAFCSIYGVSRDDFRRSSGELKVLCRFHDDHHPSLAFNPSKLLWRCFVCDSGGDLFDLYAYRQGLDRRLDFPRILKEIADLLHITLAQADRGGAFLNRVSSSHYRSMVDAVDGRSRFKASFAASSSSPTDKQRCQWARQCWAESHAAAGSVVQRYWRSRDITMPPPQTIRYHPDLKHPSGSFWPAMIAAVQSIDGQLVGIQRTYLARDGSGKAKVEPNKLSLGPIAGGAVRLAKTGDTLLLAEGIETAVSVMQATGMPAWATLGTSGLRSIGLPDPVRLVIIAADAEDAGQKAARDAARRFLAEGRRVRIARPSSGNDFNDLLRGLV